LGAGAAAGADGEATDTAGDGAITFIRASAIAATTDTKTRTQAMMTRISTSPASSLLRQN
jgi:hypothetical protein